MKGIRILLAAVLAALLFGGCGPESGGGGPGKATTETAGRTADSGRSSGTGQTTAKPPEDPVRLRLAGMTPDEKIGQLLFFGFDGTTLDEQAVGMMDTYRPGGLIVMGDNVKGASRLLELVNSLKKEASKNGIPAFISVDEEGGRVSRMPPGLADVPAALAVGRTGSADIAYGVGGVIAEELKAFGFNMDFAPVLDIWSNPKNTVIGDRAFGTDADTVVRLGVKAMKGISDAGIIPVVKHFPGHGDTTADSHKELPVSGSSPERLESFELKPFEAALADGADAVMVAHILLSKVDGENPASLSKAVVTGILREREGFDGVVVTDDMTMGAIEKNYGLGEAAVKAFQAGCDMIMVVRGYEKEQEAAEALKGALRGGAISMERLDESVYRILRLKDKYSLDNSPVESVDVEGLNREIRKVTKRIPAG